MTHQISDEDFQLLTEVKRFLAEADGQRPIRLTESPVYVALIRWAADAYKLSLRHCENDIFDRQMRFHNLCSPFVIEELAKAWQELGSLRRELEAEEAEVDSFSAIDDRTGTL